MKLLDRLNIFKRMGLVEAFIESLRKWLIRFRDDTNTTIRKLDDRATALEKATPWRDEFDMMGLEIRALEKRLYLVEKNKADRQLANSDYDLTLVADLDANFVK